MLYVTYASRSASGPRIPRNLFRDIKNAVLGPRYELSVAFVSSHTMRKLNRRYRGKSSSTDILSFPLSEQSGELMFSIVDVRKRAPLFGRSSSEFLPFLLIHGLLHLKGYAHGSKMEAQERKFRKKFNV